MPETYRDTDNPFVAIEDAIAFNSRDFAQHKFEAWIYGIVLGWDDEDNDPELAGAMDEVATNVGWDDHDVERLRRLHENWERAKRAEATLARVRTTVESLAIYRPDAEMYGSDAWDSIECIDLAAVRAALDPNGDDQ